MDKYIVTMLQSKGALYNDFFKSEQNCKKMSLITMKIIEWSAKDQNKLFDETTEEVDLAYAVTEKEIVLADSSEQKRLNWIKALYPAEV
eukprot:m51a1_g6741 hypothetical protein (89) ;mRNA; f:248423-249233